MNVLLCAGGHLTLPNPRPVLTDRQDGAILLVRPLGNEARIRS